MEKWFGVALVKMVGFEVSNEAGDGPEAESMKVEVAIVVN